MNGSLLFFIKVVQKKGDSKMSKKVKLVAVGSLLLLGVCTTVLADARTVCIAGCAGTRLENRAACILTYPEGAERTKCFNGAEAIYASCVADCNATYGT